MSAFIAVRLYHLLNYFLRFQVHLRREVLHSVYTTRGIQFLLSELDDLEDLLVERQHLFCSYFTPKYHRERVEKKIRENASVLIWYELIKKEDLNKVLREDRHCGNCLLYQKRKEETEN